MINKLKKSKAPVNTQVQSSINIQKLQFQNIFETFETTQKGLDINEINYRLKKYGKNAIEFKKEKPLLIRFLAEFKDLMVIILIIAATISLITHEVVDAAIIYLVVLINGIIGFTQKYKAEKAVEALRKLVAPQARVIRMGQQNLINTADLVPGDILILGEGDLVPADAIVFESNELEANESILTGESVPVNKSSFDIEEKGAFTSIENIVFSGTTITRGNCLAIVAKTGNNTQFGQIANLTLSTKKDLSPLEKEIRKIGKFSATIVLLISLLIFIYELVLNQLSIIETFLFVASIAVAAVPEGLPAIITIALALGVQRLSKKNAIVKQLSAVETLGACNIICTDKTGTITKNEMTVTAAFFDNYSIDFEGTGYIPTGKIQLHHKEESESYDLANEVEFEHFNRKNSGYAHDLMQLSICALLCNNSSIVKKNDNFIALGDPTEACLIPMANKLGYEKSMLDQNYIKIHELPFDSERKMMTVIVKNLQNKKIYAFSKGAPEKILHNSDQKLVKGKTTIITRSQHQELEELNQNLAASAFRVVGMAMKEITHHDLEHLIGTKNFKEKAQQIEKKLTFIGLCALIDPPREDVKEAVELTRLAGIQTYMLTGDNGLTAAKIAEQAGLIKNAGQVTIITGNDLDNMTDSETEQIFKNKHEQIIFARINPAHKLKIVSTLKNLENVVAVTGDGVNDAPALKKADIGVCMGKTGTDISREAANLVLADDSFSVIVSAVSEGRIIYENLKKFIHYIFSSNIGEVSTIVFCLILGIHAPLTALLLLTVNLATDLFPALALSVEPGEKHIMNIPPRNYHQKILNKKFIGRLMLIGLSIGLVITTTIVIKLLSLSWTLGEKLTPDIASNIYSLTFANLVSIQIINAYNARSETKSIFHQNPFNNKKLLIACLLSFLIAISLIYIPVLAQYFRLSPLSLYDWIMIITSSLIIIFIDEIRKYTVRKKMNLLSKNA